MERQLFFSRKWHYFCQVCRNVDPWGPDAAGRIVCENCYRKHQRKRAKNLGFPVTEETPYDEVSRFLDNLHIVCQYISLAWNECVSPQKGQLIVTERDKCPWSPNGAVGIPKDVIERTAARLLEVESLLDDINQSMFAMYGEHFRKSTTEVDPRYDTGQRRTVKSYWPAMRKDTTFDKVSTILWERWSRFLPFRVVTC